eukprot:Colp12_sorted_trinity150504_noHs@3919
MLSSIGGFFKRHQRKFVVAATVVSGAFAAYKYMEWRVKEAEEAHREKIAELRMKEHFESNQETCKTTAASLVPSVYRKVQTLVNCEDLTAKLRQKEGAKIELWEELKILTFVRLIATVYAISLLAAFIRVQLNTVGRYLYKDIVAATEYKPGDTRNYVPLSPEAQTRYLSMIQYLLSSGLPKLVSKIDIHVRRSFENVSLKTCMTPVDIAAKCNAIRAELEVSTRSGDGFELIELVLPSEGEQGEYLLEQMAGAPLARSADPQLLQLLAETRATVSSVDFITTVDACITAGLEAAFASLSSQFPLHETVVAGQSPSHEPLPVAKLLPVVQAALGSLCRTPAHRMLQEIQSLDILTDFAALVYSAV